MSQWLSSISIGFICNSCHTVTNHLICFGFDTSPINNKSPKCTSLFQLWMNKYNTMLNYCFTLLCNVLLLICYHIEIQLILSSIIIVFIRLMNNIITSHCALYTTMPYDKCLFFFEHVWSYVELAYGLSDNNYY